MRRHIGQFLSEGCSTCDLCDIVVVLVTCAILSRCEIEGRVDGNLSTMHFVKHEHTEFPAPINQWFQIKPSHHVGNAGCLAVVIADNTGYQSLYHFQLSLLVYSVRVPHCARVF